MKLYSISLLLALLSFASTHAQAASPPLDYIKLDNSKIERLGFKCNFSKRGNKVFFRLDYPVLMDKYFPISISIVTKTSTGKEMLRSTTWANKTENFVELQFNLVDTDVDVSVTYSCENETRPVCGPGQRYGINSVSQFVRELDIK